MNLFFSIGTVFCKRFFYFGTNLILLICLLPGSASAETLSGYIQDTKAAPVPFAFVQNQTQNLMSYSDEAGYFEIPGNNTIGDTLLFSRIGYHSQKLVVQNFKIQTIHLIPQNVSLPSIFVEGHYSKSENNNRELVKIKKSQAIKAINSRRIFSSIPGAYVKSYGGPAGISTLSMDGAPTRHTKILVSGFDITNAQNGQVDLSQLPENFIDNITYDPYSVSAFRNGSSEGVVDISPWQDRSSAFYSRGSYGMENYGFSINLNGARFNGNVMAGKSKDDGNYKAYNPVTQKYKERKNNHIRRDYFSLKFNGILTKSIFSRLLYLYSSQERGVAGQIWSPTPKSYRTDSFHLLGLKLGWATKVGAGYFQTTLRKSHDHYFSSPQDGFPFDSRHDVNTLRYKITQNFKVTDFLKYSIALNCNDDDLSSQETGNHSRLSWIFSNSLKMQIKKFKLTPLYQYNFASGLYGENTWQLTAEYTIANRYFHAIAVNLGAHFYYPSFNDLYWKPGGNPNLKPEKTTAVSMDMEFSLFRQNDFKLLVFDKSSTNLIQWVPSVSYWQPANIKKSRRQGMKGIYSFALTKIPVTGFINYTYNFSEDESTGEQLLYTPRHSAGLNLDYTAKKWQLHYQAYFTDDRISRYSWPQNVTIEKVLEHTVGISCDFNFKLGTISNSFLIENLTDENYETIKGYPEPGRTFKYRIQYYINQQRGEKNEENQTANSGFNCCYAVKQLFR